MENPVSQCAQLIKEAKNIAALTGAGISTNAGIPDFRGPKGLYITRQYDPEKVFEIDYFFKDPAPFYQFARDFILLEEKIKPTFAHEFLSDLEQDGKLKGVVTQNIDSLHQSAGSQNIYEIHGSFWTSICLDCYKDFSYAQMKRKLAVEDIPHCECGGLLKPEIVFFGEDVKHLDESARLASESDLFFVIGTSCAVYPAGMIPLYARGKIVVINQSQVNIPSGNVVLTVMEDIDEFFAKVAKELSGKR